MSSENFSIGDRVRWHPADEGAPASSGKVGVVMESDGQRGITWRVLVDWQDGEPPAFMDTSRVEHAG